MSGPGQIQDLGWGNPFIQPYVPVGNFPYSPYTEKIVLNCPTCGGPCFYPVVRGGWAYL